MICSMGLFKTWANQEKGQRRLTKKVAKSDVAKRVSSQQM